MKRILPAAFNPLTIGAILAALLFVRFFAADRYYEPSAEERSRAGDAVFRKGVTVGVAWAPADGPSFVHGVRLAWEEANAEGPFAGKIRLKEVTETRDGGAAQRLARDPGVVAVLGHEFSSGAVPASITYERHGILFLTPKATEPRLTTHGFRFVFRITPDDKAIAEGLAGFAERNRLKRIAVLYARTEHGESFAPRFVAAAAEHGLEVPVIRSYLPREDRGHPPDLRALIGEMRQEPFDAVLVADEMPRVAHVLRDLERMGVEVPILGTDKLDTPALWGAAGTAAVNLYVASAVDPSSATPAYREFQRRFRERFQADPDYGASQGYEAFRLLVRAWTISETAAPVVVATTLRTRSWQGLFGEFSFTAPGDVLGRQVSIKHARGGALQTVSSLLAESDPPEDKP